MDLVNHTLPLSVAVFIPHTYFLVNLGLVLRPRLGLPQWAR
jgi:hypothetical protein